MSDLVFRLRVSAYSITKMITVLENGGTAVVEDDTWTQLESLLDEAADELEKAQKPEKLVWS